MYRLNGHYTAKQALPCTQTRQHRYYPHYYPMPCGDIYLITPKGEIRAILADRDDCIVVWCPYGGLYPFYWVPTTTLLRLTDSGDPCDRVCLDGNESNAFGSAMTDDTLCVMTSPISGLIIRRGVIIYDGKMDGRWVPARLISIDDTETLATTNQWAKDDLGKYLGQGSDPYKYWVWHKKVRHGQCGSGSCLDYGICLEYTAGSGVGTIHIGHYQGLCCSEDSNCSGSSCRLGTYDNTEEVRWASYTKSNAWGRSLDCETAGTACMSMPSVFVDKDKDGLSISNAIQDGRYGFASFQIESVVKRFKWRTWLGEAEDATELPGYKGWSETDIEDQPMPDAYIKTDWQEVRDYEIVIPVSTLEENENAGALLRRGLQTGDCFYNEERDVYWRMEYNGWKEYEGFADRQSQDAAGKYGIILPGMTESYSAHNSE